MTSDEPHKNNRAQELAAADLSVVIPTRNRAPLLRRVLDALERQAAQLNGAVEIIVCDDASSDDTRRELSRERNVALIWISLPENAGPAKARNRALALSRGRIILFLGDDVEPAAGLLRRHLDWHARHSGPEAALLGRTAWPTGMTITPFMRFLEGRGRAFFFDYADLPADRPVPGLKFYTSHVSMKRALYEQVGGFDEAFVYASHEDLEYGFRLESAGVKLYYDPDAVGYHWHALDHEQTVRRIYRMGISSILFWSKVPRPVARRHACARWLMTRIFGIRLLRAGWRRLGRAGCLIEWQWWLLLQGVYWAGAADGRRGVVDKACMNVQGPS